MSHIILKKLSELSSAVEKLCLHETLLTQALDESTTRLIKLQARYDAAVAYDIADLLHGVSAELPHPPDSAFGERPLPSKPINAAVANAIRDAKFPKPIAKAPDTEPLPVASVID